MARSVSPSFADGGTPPKRARPCSRRSILESALMSGGQPLKIEPAAAHTFQELLRLRRSKVSGFNTKCIKRFSLPGSTKSIVQTHACSTRRKLSSPGRQHFSVIFSN
mmetsp:Transcript_155946/g.276593  ORF Transcript_155946/g.276593 Transcript_155946/m.276593 type:complete len:107 (-) Transcript_155946:119-439(-)